MQYLKAYLGAICALLVLDSIWLGFLVGDFYRQQIGHLMADAPLLPAAVGFYLIYVVGVVVLAVRPAILTDSWRSAAAHGAVLGVVAYATYDLTNYATLIDWPVNVVIVDVLWGAALTSATAAAGYLAARIGDRG